MELNSLAAPTATGYIIKYNDGSFLQAFSLIGWNAVTTGDEKRAFVFQRMSMATIVALMLDRSERFDVIATPVQQLELWIETTNNESKPSYSDTTEQK